MKRFHVNLKVSDMEKSRAYYSGLFAASPSVDREGYIKWMLDDPFINFSIEPAEGETGIAHVGIQAEDAAELSEVYARLDAAGGPTFAEGETTCCFAHSHKNWTRDPDGLIWETFFTDGQVTQYGQKPDVDGLNLPDKQPI